MNKREKTLLMEYLYPTEEACNFITCEVNPILREFLPVELCISEENVVKKMRKLNYQRAYLRICEFLFANEKIWDKLNLFCGTKNSLNGLVDDLIVNYVFCLTQTHKEYEKIDIFKNKKSICFRAISNVDVIVWSPLYEEG